MITTIRNITQRTIKAITMKMVNGYGIIRKPTIKINITITPTRQIIIKTTKLTTRQTRITINQIKIMTKITIKKVQQILGNNTTIRIKITINIIITMQ
jgi:hypothetical protein